MHYIGESSKKTYISLFLLHFEFLFQYSQQDSDIWSKSSSRRSPSSWQWHQLWGSSVLWLISLPPMEILHTHSWPMRQKAATKSKINWKQFNCKVQICLQFTVGQQTTIKNMLENLRFSVTLYKHIIFHNLQQSETYLDFLVTGN